MVVLMSRSALDRYDKNRDLQTDPTHLNALNMFFSFG